MSDMRIIESIRDGGRAELAIVYEKYRAEFIHWIAREFRCTAEDGKDIYQLTILLFYENIRSGKLQHLVSSVKTYLFAIGKNVARETMRKAKRNIGIDQQKWLSEYLVDETDPKLDENLFTIAKDVVGKLGQPCQRLVELYYYEKKSMAEISAVMDYKNADTAKNQKCKCMARLRELFQKQLSSTPISNSI